MPRFVALMHDWPEPHLDLLLESGDALRAWKLPADYNPHAVSAITTNAPHRRLYLDYEGIVAGDRGSVARWDIGEYEWRGEGRAVFSGRRLIGVYEWRPDGTGGLVFGPVT